MPWSAPLVQGHVPGWDIYVTVIMQTLSCFYMVLSLDFIQTNWDMVFLFLETAGLFIAFVIFCLSFLFLSWETLWEGLHCDPLGPLGNNSIEAVHTYWLCKLARRLMRGKRWFGNKRIPLQRALGKGVLAELAQDIQILVYRPEVTSDKKRVFYLSSKC